MDSPLRVLLLEDSPADARLIELELEQNGYAPAIERVDTCQSHVGRCHRRLLHTAVQRARGARDGTGKGFGCPLHYRFRRDW